MFYVYGCDIRKSTLIGALVAIISLYFNNILFRLLLLLYKNAHFQKYYYCNFRLCEYMQTFYYSISNPYLHNQHLHLQIRLYTQTSSPISTVEPSFRKMLIPCRLRPAFEYEQL